MSVEFYNLSYFDRVNKIIDSLKLKETPTDNDIIKNRFLYEVIQYENKRDNTRKYYNGLRFVMTIGSILLPAILSIGQMDPAKLPRNFESITYWTSWSLSLTITACNGFLQLFSLDKKFDPNLHQAMMEIDDDQKEIGTIVQEIQKGFMMKDRLLRPSLVGVSKKTEKKEEKNQENKENSDN